MDVKEFINCIRKRPYTYFTEVRLDYIFYLVGGYVLNSIKNESGSTLDYSFKKEFNGWVLNWIRENRNENYELPPYLWYQFIRDVTNSEEEAVELFFELCDAFFQEKVENQV